MLPVPGDGAGRVSTLTAPTFYLPHHLPVPLFHQTHPEASGKGAVVEVHMAQPARAGNTVEERAGLVGSVFLWSYSHPMLFM